jgi:hypothetical protein
MLRSHQRWYREQYQALLDGPRGEQWRALSRALRKLTLHNGDELVTHIRDSAWLIESDRNTRLLAMALIGKRFAQVRVQNGYAPFDDSLPGEEPTPAEVIRGMLSHQRLTDLEKEE